MPFFILTLKCCYCNIKKILYFFIIYLFMLFQAVFRDRQLTGKYKPSKMEYHQVRPQFLVKHIFSNKNISWEGRFFLQKVLIRLWSIFFYPKSRYFSSKSFSREGRYFYPTTTRRESRYFSSKRVSREGRYFFPKSVRREGRYFLQKGYILYLNNFTYCNAPFTNSFSSVVNPEWSICDF